MLGSGYLLLLHRQEEKMQLTEKSYGSADELVCSPSVHPLLVSVQTGRIPSGGRDPQGASGF